MKNVEIASLGHYVPKRILSNNDLEKLVDTSDEWIISRTGIKERRIAEKEERTSDMAINAAREAIKRSEITASDIELIVVATTTPDSSFPSVACLVQRAIGSKLAATFDVSAACSGCLYALTTAKQFLISGLYKNAPVIAVDKFSNLLNWNDRSTCVLFGDGAGAAMLTLTKAKRGILSDFIRGHGQFADLMAVISEERSLFDQKTEKIRIPFVEMKGQELFKIAVNSMSEAVKIAAEKAKIKISDITCVVPHQANDRIISAVAKKLKLSKELFFINIQRYGNMSAASIAVALSEAVNDGYIKKGDIVALVTFGAGLVSAANIVKF